MKGGATTGHENLEPIGARNHHDQYDDASEFMGFAWPLSDVAVSRLVYLPVMCLFATGELWRELWTRVLRSWCGYRGL